MASIERIKGSDSSGDAQVATVQTTRSPGASTIIVDTVVGINPTGFMASMGTPHTFTDPITSETITVISEATAVDFAGHVDGANLEIDTIAPGYTDAGSAVGDIIIIRPTTQWSDNVAETLEVGHNDDGSTKRDIKFYTANDTYIPPANLKYIIAKQKAGGGGGGGVGTTSGTGAAGGGGEGELVISKVPAASLGASAAIVIGAGGAGGTATGGDGTVGSDTTLGTTIVVAKGGSGGSGSNGVQKMQAGGAGGTGGTANWKEAGIRGGYANDNGTNVRSGDGGGKGGGASVGSATGGGAAVANSGGGGGGALGTTTTGQIGGAGGSGWMIIEEYF